MRLALSSVVLAAALAATGCSFGPPPRSPLAQQAEYGGGLRVSDPGWISVWLPAAPATARDFNPQNLQDPRTLKVSTDDVIVEITYGYRPVWGEVVKDRVARIRSNMINNRERELALWQDNAVTLDGRPTEELIYEFLPAGDKTVSPSRVSFLLVDDEPRLYFIKIVSLKDDVSISKVARIVNSIHFLPRS